MAAIMTAANRANIAKVFLVFIMLYVI